VDDRNSEESKERKCKRLDSTVKHTLLVSYANTAIGLRIVTILEKSKVVWIKRLPKQEAR
jgi:hypothetical protein